MLCSQTLQQLQSPKCSTKYWNTSTAPSGEGVSCNGNNNTFKMTLIIWVCWDDNGSRFSKSRSLCMTTTFFTKHIICSRQNPLHLHHCYQMILLHCTRKTVQHISTAQLSNSDFGAWDHPQHFLVFKSWQFFQVLLKFTKTESVLRQKNCARGKTGAPPLNLCIYNDTHRKHYCIEQSDQIANEHSGLQKTGWFQCMHTHTTCPGQTSEADGGRNRCIMYKIRI